MKVLKLIGLFVSFAFAANNAAVYPPLTDSHLLTVGTDEQFTAEEIYQIIFKPLPPGVHFSKYIFHSDFYFPSEIWLEVLGHSDPMTIWNFGLTCKWSAAFTRDSRNGINQIWAVPENMGQLLLNGELKLHNWAAEILEPLLKSLKWNIIVKNIQIFPGQWELLYQKWYQLCSRSADLKIAQLAFRVFNLGGFHDTCLAPIRDHLYGHLKDFSSSFYLPPNDGVPLLERIDPRLIAALANDQHRLGRNKRFAIPLLLDYIIPSFQKRNRISARERDLLCFILPHQYSCLKDYMKYLLWALYFQTRTLRRNEKTVIGQIVNHLESFHLEWERLCGGRPAVLEFELQKYDLDEHKVRAIYIVAKQWKLDLTKIATNSSWFPLSKQILAGEFSNFIANKAPNISCLDLYKIIYRVEPFKLKIEGSSILYEPTNNSSQKRAGGELEEEPGAKRQRLDGATSQGSFEVSMMNKGNQIQMEVNTQVHPSQYVISTDPPVVEINVSDEQLVGEIMSKIAWLQQMIPNSIAQVNTQGSVVDVNYFVQTLNNLQSTVQNILPKFNFCQPQLQYQYQYDQCYGPSSSQAPFYQQPQNEPIYPQVQQMHHYPQAQPMNQYVQQAQQIQAYYMPSQQPAAYQPNLPQSLQQDQGFQT